MVLAYSPQSRYASLFRSGNWIRALTTPGVQFGLADPRFDATGYRALMVLELAQGYYHDYHLFADMTVGRFSPPITVTPAGGRNVIEVPQLLDEVSGTGLVLRGAAIELVALLEAGDLDCAFEYESVARQHHLPFVVLPPQIDLGSRRYAADYAQVAVSIAFQRFADVTPVFVGAPIAYAVTIPRTARNPAEAARFIAFLLGPARPPDPGRELPAGRDARTCRPLPASTVAAAVAVSAAQSGPSAVSGTDARPVEGPPDRGDGETGRPRRHPAIFAVVSWVLGLLLLVFVAAPVVALVTGTSPTTFFSTLGESDVRQALLVSVEAAVLATALAAVGGIPLAYLLARRSFPGKRLVEGLIDLPIVFPHTAAGIALLLVFGRTGVFGRGFAQLGIAFTDTLAGVVVAMLFVSLPFLVDTAREAFALVDPSYEHVARTLGATPGVAFARVALPLARRGVLAGALLMWARGMSEFGAIVILAYNPKSMSVLVYERFEGLGLGSSQTGSLGNRAACPRGLHRGSHGSWSTREAAMISAAGLRVRVGSFTLGPIDLAVADGEYVAVVGPSGAGKSVLLEALAGLRPVAAGRIADGVHDVTAVPPERRGIGLVGQRALLFPHLTVERNILFGLELATGHLLRRALSGPRRRASGGGTDAAQRVHEVAEALGVTALLPRRPGSLSGGECQRVALARALAARPRAMLLDEPLSALDSEAREDLQAELLRVHERFAMTTIHVTHSLDEALAVARRCVVMIDGRIAQDGPIDDVVTRPVSGSVARLTGARNVLPATAIPAPGGGCEVTLADGLSLRALGVARGPVTVVVRAEIMTLHSSRASDAASRPASQPAVADNVVSARVLDVRVTSTGYLVSVDAGGLKVFVPRAYGDGFEPTPGAAAVLVIPVASVHVISTS